MAVAGSGVGGEPQVRQALRRLHRIRDVPEADAADAVAVAAAFHLSQTPALQERHAMIASVQGSVTERLRPGHRRGGGLGYEVFVSAATLRACRPRASASVC